MYRNFFRSLLFRLDPERAHELTLDALRLVGALPPLRAALRRAFALQNQSPVEVFGLKFPNAVGLAAGYDKDGLAWRGLASLGFGHIEIGTVTPRPQAGNPKPRVFRIPEEQAVINRMGFPGRGAEFVAQQLAPVTARRSSVVIGINLGKNKDTPNEEAAQDYLYLLEKFSPLADYLTVNISSPNTVGLRRLQARAALEDLLSQLNAQRLTFNLQRPILVKLAPDLTDEELDDALDAITRTGMEGVIATNTTTNRAGVRSALAQESGGLSGAPLTRASTTIIQKIYQRTNGKLPIIGVGGIMTPEDAKEKLDAGATLVQIFTGLIYRGPKFVKVVAEYISRRA
ncbi:MAG: quinone-dependent dihydroorotate dehydrogenase [Chloroflexi bacterium]|jgi:dihydroorotate dehydrogenase|nr:quinone-dependent dihydroorotate dehydrogenase [Chloroflexota bacterium]